jgi:hypothetical protein
LQRHRLRNKKARQVVRFCFHFPGMIHIGSQSKFIPYVWKWTSLDRLLQRRGWTGQKDKGREGPCGNPVAMHIMWHVATRMHIRNDKGNQWTKAANHRPTTPYLNAAYQMDLMRKAAIISGKMLEARFVTYDFAAPLGLRLDRHSSGIQ